ncbi:hypothetical protein CAPTEDRAFT_210948 [Capitella teleta]|uniref:Uncharacterized protein n=1 Tax=Capitella teleta TaxID=283909 RepID=R7TUC9_CAPTE|nr:hypothetical protein CAPTEDRAFT_210948 [Capitella teleta]|eukprot:ELT95071.1 hypothetical protein CAPTEDRAFT_210948 [Capitella teleta]
MEEFGIEISEAKSSVVRFNREPRQEKWKCGGWQVCENGAAKYLGMSVVGGVGEGFAVLGMVKFGAKRSGCQFLVAREGWKSEVVSMATYGAGAIVWKRTEVKSLEVMQSEFGRWLWRVDRSVRNSVVQGEFGWSTFEKREVKAKIAFVKKILWGGTVVTEVGRAALLEIGIQSGWWKEVERMAFRFHWDELAHLIWSRRVSETEREMCGAGEDWIRDMTKEKMNEQVMEVGKQEWKRSLQSPELTRMYAVEKEAVKLESYADGSVGARVRMLLRGDCLPFWHKRQTNGGILML